MAIQLVSDIKKAEHFTSHEARFAAIDALREAHGARLGSVAALFLCDRARVRRTSVCFNYRGLTQ